MGRIKKILESDIKVDSAKGIVTLTDVKITTGKKGWKVANKDNRYYISKDGRVYMEVERNHPEVK